MNAVLSPEEIRRLEEKQTELLQKLIELQKQRKLESYRPYKKQLEFHAAGRTFRERLLRAASQSGKSLSAAAETAMHLTGRYPDWWPGRRFTTATKGWVVSESMQFSRDNAQRHLLGEPLEWGTGYIPADSISKIVRALHSVTDAVDTVNVRHVSGSMSKLMFKSVEVERNKLGGDTIDFAWLDEEPPSSHYEEVLTRTNVKQGPVYTTFTPLKGQTELVKRFLIDKLAGTHDTVMTIYEVEHYTPQQREEIIATYPSYSRAARTMGVPTMGSGVVFTTDEKKIKITPFQIPKHWPRIAGQDFGIAHPYAMAWFAIDRDTDTSYLYKVYRASGETPTQHYAPYRDEGDWIPVAWPADALITEKGTGASIASQYRKAGFTMLRDKAMMPRSAHIKTDRQALSVEAGVLEMSEAMEAGRFRVFSNLDVYFEELRLYHRDERGMIVKKGDDLISACLSGDTLIVTQNGIKPISGLVGTNGNVLTVGGRWTRYKNCRKTRANAKTITVHFEDGSNIRCTPEHRFMVGGVWVEARALQSLLCDTTVSHSGDTRCASKSSVRQNRNSMGVSTADMRAGGTTPATLIPCIEMSGHSTMGRFLQSITFTTRNLLTKIKLRTWNARLGLFTYQNITRESVRVIRQSFTSHKRSGPKVRKDKNYLARAAREMLISCMYGGLFHVNSAPKDSDALTMEETGFVLTLADPNGGENPVPTMKSENVLNAERTSPVISTTKSSVIALRNAGLRVLSVREDKPCDVYCMEVPETEAFVLENGIISHNCRYGWSMRRHARTKSESERRVYLPPMEHSDRV